MIVWIAAALAIFYSLSSLALALLFASRLRILDDRPLARVTLVLPATGPLPGLEDLLTALRDQSLRPQRLIVAVESQDDPAYQRFAAMAERYAELNIELVVAGLSALRGQKCTNLLAALARLDNDDTNVVLLDADIRPQPWWLAALVAPLAAGRADVVNGYRWQMPSKLTLATGLGVAVDRAIAVLPRLRQAKTIWGGSLAVTRHALDILDLPTTIGRTLTEDLPIGDRVAETGLRLLTRRAIRAPTPLGGSFCDLWRFGRRQYQGLLIYRPGLWSYAAFVVTTDLIARLVLLSALIVAGASGPALSALLVVAALGSIAAEVRLAAGKRLGVSDGIGIRLLQHLLVWATLPIPAFHASVIWGGVVTSPVRWAHIRYVVDKTGRVTDVARRPYSDQSV
jgi:cellulose synthase/poly-beta-1,6-N-acetylglucosamine synthase-like glycosyltransferase